MQNKHKTALITGGTSGIGLELARLFAKDRYNLVIVARNQNESDAAANELRQFGVEVTTIAKDLSKMEDAKSLCNEISNLCRCFGKRCRARRLWPVQR